MLSNIQLKNYFSEGFILVDKLLSEEEIDKFLMSQEQNKKKNYNSCNQLQIYIIYYQTN